VDPGAYTAGLEALERDARALQRALQDARGVADAADGLVQATVSGRGELIELVLDPRIYRVQDSEALAADITAAIREAAGQAQEEVLAKARRLLLPPGQDPATVDLEFDPFLDHLRRARGSSTP
jgi:DNA-binding protein YbaB